MHPIHPALRPRHRRRSLRFTRSMLNGHSGDVTPAVKKAIVRAVRAGLVVTSTTGGQHASTSLHYTRPGRAVDVGLPASLVGTAEGRRRMVAFQRKEARHPQRFDELFGPDNVANVKNGSPIVLGEGTPLENLHDTHVHLAPRH